MSQGPNHIDFCQRPTRSVLRHDVRIDRPNVGVTIRQREGDKPTVEIDGRFEDAYEALDELIVALQQIRGNREEKSAESQIIGNSALGFAMFMA